MSHDSPECGSRISAGEPILVQSESLATAHIALEGVEPGGVKCPTLHTVPALLQLLTWVDRELTNQVSWSH